MKLDGLSRIKGCLLAVVIDNEGNCLASMGEEGSKGGSVEKTAKAMAEVTYAMEKLSIEMELLTGRSCLPQEGWAFMGTGLAAIMGNGGYRGVVLDKPNLAQMKALKECFALIEDPERPEVAESLELACPVEPEFEKNSLGRRV